MKRSYLSNEINYVPIEGTYNMTEQKSFFGSKMMDIENLIVINDKSLKYFQSNSREQLNLTIDSNNLPIIYSMVDDKFDNSEIIIDESQLETNKDKNISYIINIDLKKILGNYIFAQLKTNRVFESIKNQQTKYGDIDLAIKDYINDNIYDRYSFSSIDFFIKMKNITLEPSFDKKISKQDKNKKIQEIPSEMDFFTNDIWSIVKKNKNLINDLKKSIIKIKNTIENDNNLKIISNKYLLSKNITTDEFETFENMIKSSFGGSIIFKYLKGEVKLPGKLVNIRTDRGLINSMISLSKQLYIDLFPKKIIDYWNVVNIDNVNGDIEIPTISEDSKQFSNRWNKDIGENKFRFNNILTTTSFDDSNLQLKFNQPLISSEYNFDYYFNIRFVKKSIIENEDNLDDKLIFDTKIVLNDISKELNLMNTMLIDKIKTGQFLNSIYTSSIKYINDDLFFKTIIDNKNVNYDILSYRDKSLELLKGMVDNNKTNLKAIEIYKKMFINNGKYEINENLSLLYMNNIKVIIGKIRKIYKSQKFIKMDKSIIDITHLLNIDLIDLFVYRTDIINKKYKLNINDK